MLGDAQRRHVRISIVRACLHRGFTLIEMMIALVIVALLALLAAPMYGEMIANTEIRNASENILMGLRTAQGEAIRLNAPAKLVLDSSGWQVLVTDRNTYDFDASPYRTYKFNEGARRATVTPTPSTATEVVFNGLGQILHQDTAISQVDVTTSSISNPHALRILIGTKDVAAGMKMCDPNYAVTDPVGCPST
jgi:prepilin-type N-terminal cleavage/methylation domain-containing protein